MVRERLRNYMEDREEKVGNIAREGRAAERQDYKDRVTGHPRSKAYDYRVT